MMENLKRIFRQKRIYLLLLCPISILLVLISKNSSLFAEQIYALVIYRFLSQVLSNITGIIPISVAECVILITPILVLAQIVVGIIRRVKKREKLKIDFLQGVFYLLVVCSVLLFTFLICGGLNYYRFPFTYYSNLEIKESSVEELYNVTVALAQQANELRAEISEQKEEDIFQLTLSTKELAKEAKKAFDRLSIDYPVLGGNYGRPKGIMLSSLFSYTEITGIFIPFTMEANVNIDIPDYTIPVTMLHEMAHQRGFMREDEANFIAYMAGMESDHLELQYSSTMLALIIAGNALYKENKDLYFEARGIYQKGLLVDLRDNTIYWSKFEQTTVSVMSNKLNDTYLKINDQKDGVKSYGRMIDLLLAKYRTDNNLMQNINDN